MRIPGSWSVPEIQSGMSAKELDSVKEPIVSEQRKFVSGAPHRRMIAVLAALWIALACSCGAGEPDETEDALPPLSSHDPAVRLNISVGLVNKRLLFTNLSGTAVTRILVVFNEGDPVNEFKHTIGVVQANSMMHFTPSLFKNAEGLKFNVDQHEVKTVTAYADTPKGRGRYYGAYLGKN